MTAVRPSMPSRSIGTNDNDMPSFDFLEAFLPLSLGNSQRSHKYNTEQKKRIIKIITHNHMPAEREATIRYARNAYCNATMMMAMINT